MTYDSPITITLTLAQWNRISNALTVAAETDENEGWTHTAELTRAARDAMRAQRDAAKVAALAAA